MSKALKANWALPPIPDKPRYTPGDVARICGIKMSVLRQWSLVFPQLRSHKQKGSLDFYRRPDVELICKIKHLVDKEGFSLSGVKKALDLDEKVEPPTNAVDTVSRDEAPSSEPSPDMAALEAFINGAEEASVSVPSVSSMDEEVASSEDTVSESEPQVAVESLGGFISEPEFSAITDAIVTELTDISELLSQHGRPVSA